MFFSCSGLYMSVACRIMIFFLWVRGGGSGGLLPELWSNPQVSDPDFNVLTTLLCYLFMFSKHITTMFMTYVCLHWLGLWYWYSDICTFQCLCKLHQFALYCKFMHIFVFWWGGGGGGGCELTCSLRRGTLNCLYASFACFLLEWFVITVVVHFSAYAGISTA